MSLSLLHGPLGLDGAEGILDFCAVYGNGDSTAGLGPPDHLSEGVVRGVADLFAARYRGALESPHATKDSRCHSGGGSSGLGRVVELVLVPSSRGER